MIHEHSLQKSKLPSKSACSFVINGLLNKRIQNGVSLSNVYKKGFLLNKNISFPFFQQQQKTFSPS